MKISYDWLKQYIDLPETPEEIGKVLTSTGTLVNDGTTLLYRATKHDCDACELKPRCYRKCLAARRRVQSANRPETCARHREDRCLCQVAAERKKIEMLFTHLKRILRPPLEAALMKRQALAGLRYVGVFKSRTSNYRSRHSLIGSAAGTIRG